MELQDEIYSPPSGDNSKDYRDSSQVPVTARDPYLMRDRRGGSVPDFGSPSEGLRRKSKDIDSPSPAPVNRIRRR